jgi:hypothetical protein
MRSVQTGVALAVVLVLIALGSLIALSGMTQAVVDERIAGNQRQVAEIFLAAEAGLLRVGQWWEQQTGGQRHDQIFWNDPEGASAALAALDRTIRPGLTWSLAELRFDGDEVRIGVRAQIDGVGAVREVSARYRRPSESEPAVIRGRLFGWVESPGY